ncbi:MAG: hypothetical protein ABMB14_32285, partial [Myxococcota bacterium]
SVGGGTSPASTRATGGWTGTVPWTWAAAAAVLLAVGSSAGTAAWMSRAPSATPDAPTTPVATATPAEQWETDVRDATAELRGALDARRGELDPETLAIVDQNLAIIDQAIADTRAALEADPGDQQLEGVLLTAYNQKIRVLQQVLRLPRA